MSDLFGQEHVSDDGMMRAAIISPCGTYRYTLSRVWNENLPRPAWICLNPSTANHLIDDASVRRMTSFSRSFVLEGQSFGGFDLYNLFGFRSSKPIDLRTAADPVGPDNNAHLARLASLDRKLVIVAWGGSIPTKHRERENEVLKLLASRTLYCLGKTGGGYPCHPLFLPNATQLEIFRPAKE